MRNAASAESIRKHGLQSKQKRPFQRSWEISLYAPDQNPVASSSDEDVAGDSPGVPDLVDLTDLFVYDRLDTTRREIRLLKIVPGCQDHITLEMEHFQLDTAPPYSAISYVWGSQRSKRPIQVNGKTLCIGRNLYELFQTHGVALRGLYLWADQIAINQNAIDERNHQVQLMEEIYRRAEEVIVWLGKSPTAEYAALGVKILRPENDSDPSSHKIAKLGVRREAALKDLVGNRYWRRHWIIQELYFAKRTRLLYGKEIMPRESMYALWQFTLHRPQQRLLHRPPAFHLFKNMSGDSSKEWHWTDAMNMCSKTLCEDPGIRDSVPVGPEVQDRS